MNMNYLKDGLKDLIAKVINHVRSELIRDMGLKLLWTISLIIISMWVLLMVIEYQHFDKQENYQWNGYERGVAPTYSDEIKRSNVI